MINSLLNKVIVREYYRQNVGFFAVVVAIAGSFMRSVEHIALATYAVHSLPLLVMLYFSLWTLYVLKTVLFVLKAFTNPKHEFLYLLRLLPFKNQITNLLAVQLLLNQPFLIYGLFVLFQGVKYQTWFSVSLILLFFVVSLLVPVFVYWRALQNPNASQQLRKLSYVFNLRFTKPYPLFFIQHLLTHQKMSFFSTKLFTCLSIWFVLWLYPTDDYDERLISLGVLLAGLAHSVLTLHFHQFEQQQLLVYRNLPLILRTRFLNHTLTYGILFVPEAILLLRNLPDGVSYGYTFGAVSFGLGLVLLCHNFVYFKPLLLEDSAKWVFWSLIAGFFGIMFGLSVWLLAGLCVLLAVWLFYRYYQRVQYSFES